MPPGTTASFEIVSIDVPQKRIGLRLVEEGSSRIGGTSSTEQEPERDELKPADEPQRALGSLGDKLRDALHKR